jgi:hypothetical protein
VTLQAAINPLGADTTYQFQYGPTSSYGASAPVPGADLGAGRTDQLASASAKVNRTTIAIENDASSEAWSDAAKAMSRKLRPTDSIYRLSTDTFALVLPETDVLNAKRIAVRLQEELQAVRSKHNLAFDITAHNYPEHVKSSHELEEIVKSLLPAQDEWASPVPVGKI